MAPLADLDATDAFMKAAREQFSKPTKTKDMPLHDDQKASNPPQPPIPSHVYPSPLLDHPTYFTEPVYARTPHPPLSTNLSIHGNQTFSTPCERTAIPLAARVAPLSTLSVARHHHPIISPPTTSNNAKNPRNCTAEVGYFIKSFTTASFLNGRAKVLAAPRACLPRRYEICELIMMRPVAKGYRGAKAGWTILGVEEEVEPEVRKSFGAALSGGTPYWWW